MHFDFFFSESALRERSCNLTFKILTRFPLQRLKISSKRLDISRAYFLNSE
jgi:hypothetical protein